MTKNHIVTMLFLGILLILWAPVSASAQTIPSPAGYSGSPAATQGGQLQYQPLEPLSTGNAQQPRDYSSLPVYLNYLFKLLIAVGAIVGVARITLSGFRYMLSSVSPTKADARNTIISSVWGLVLLLGVVTILTAVNPSLTDFSFFNKDLSQLGLQANETTSASQNTPTTPTQSTGSGQAGSPGGVTPYGLSIYPSLGQNESSLPSTWINNCATLQGTVKQTGSGGGTTGNLAYLDYQCVGSDGGIISVPQK